MRSTPFRQSPVSASQHLLRRYATQTCSHARTFVIASRGAGTQTTDTQIHTHVHMQIDNARKARERQAKTISTNPKLVSVGLALTYHTDTHLRPHSSRENKPSLTRQGKSFRSHRSTHTLHTRIQVTPKHTRECQTPCQLCFHIKFLLKPTPTCT